MARQQRRDAEPRSARSGLRRLRWYCKSGFNPRFVLSTWPSMKTSFGACWLPECAVTHTQKIAASRAIPGPCEEHGLKGCATSITQWCSCAGRKYGGHSTSARGEVASYNCLLSRVASLEGGDGSVVARSRCGPGTCEATRLLHERGMCATCHCGRMRTGGRDWRNMGVVRLQGEVAASGAAQEKA
ncbi:hypothetical protein B0H17DRAFT_1137822 [Mycena rosella]|uniref:Uncharacterized protein n=1 Tax=Mycena rosella TaxID=1033263 RepID=A0AAD7D7M0_MYCRO|nr:hypothetical protein B0H17DRAFT_1137822 [Mycena rosella]